MNPRPKPRRAHSLTLAYVTPWLTVMLGSLTPGWLTIAAAPVVPPLGFSLLLCWRQLRPGLLPAWSGLPLGLFDDLVSGQPFGSAMMSWTLAMLLLDLFEYRWPWRNYAIEWLVAALMLVGYILLTAALANAGGGATPLVATLPQCALTVLIYPLLGRMLGALDRMRLARFRVFG